MFSQDRKEDEIDEDVIALAKRINISVDFLIARGNVKAYKVFREIPSDRKSAKWTFTITTIVDNGFSEAKRKRYDSKMKAIFIFAIFGGIGSLWFISW